MSKEPESSTKLPKTRSPSYPAFSLPEAIGKLPALYAAMKRHEVAPETAISAMGLSHKGSTGKLALAAMRSFGLIEGRGAVKLSRRGLDLGVDYKPTDASWKQAAKDAALTPDMHKLLWDKYGSDLPIDDELRRFLVREHGFNDNVVGQFVADYKKTIEFSGLANEDKTEKNEDIPPPPSVKVGDYVQWTSAGVDQFSVPRRVLEIVGDAGEWARVEGSDTGIPMSELTIQKTAEATKTPPGQQSSPDAFPQRGSPPKFAPILKGPSISFPLPNENTIEIRLAKPVSKKDFEKIKKLLDLSEDSLVGNTESE